MGRFKICVYAIAKNEEKFARRFYESAKKADSVVVLDTGSTDNTVKILQTLGVTVKTKIFEPFRFDEARNESLKLIPRDTDICICLDLDEILCPDWREKLEAVWSEDTDRARYRYVWNYNTDGSEGHVFFAEKIHKYGAFEWKYPVHEVLSFKGEKPIKTVTVEGFEIYHKADDAKSRAQYLPLLELSAKENPSDDRTAHYLGREYMFRKDYEKAIAELKRHLALPSAVWHDERSASMTYIGRCLDALGQDEEAKRWLLKAHIEAPHLREPLTEFASVCYRKNDWYGVIFAVREALKIVQRTESYITSPLSWGNYLFDIASIAYYHVGDIENAKKSAKTALKISYDERIEKNLKLFESIIKGLRE